MLSYAAIGGCITSPERKRRVDSQLAFDPSLALGGWFGRRGILSTGMECDKQ
jgi:hypothetical protein